MRSTECSLVQTGVRGALREEEEEEEEDHGIRTAPIVPNWDEDEDRQTDIWMYGPITTNAESFLQAGQHINM